MARLQFAAGQEAGVDSLPPLCAVYAGRAQGSPACHPAHMSDGIDHIPLKELAAG